MRKKIKIPEEDLIYRLREIFDPRRISYEHPQTNEPELFFRFGSKGWRLNQKEKENLENAVQILKKQFNKVHKETCQKYLQSFCCDEFPAKFDTFHERIPKLFQDLQKVADNQSIVAVEVAGLRMDIDSFEFGKFEFVLSNDPALKELRESIRAKDGDASEPIPSGSVLAKRTLQGDSSLVREVAKEDLQQTIDVLQFISAFKNPSILKPDIQGFSLYVGENRKPAVERTWSHNTSPNERWEAHNMNAERPSNDLPQYGLLLNEQTIDEFKSFGWDGFNQLLLKEEVSFFERNLLSANRWFAKAVRDIDPSRKFVDLFIALESLFSDDIEHPEKSRAVFNTREGVAFFLGENIDERLKIYKWVNDLAKVRNKVVHSGFSEIERDDLNLLFRLTQKCCLCGLELSVQFGKSGSFSKWARRFKFSQP